MVAVKAAAVVAKIASLDYCRFADVWVSFCVLLWVLVQLITC